MKFYDAHCHLPASFGERSVVNGTHPSDWPEILNTAKQHKGILPAIGLHPWKIKDAPVDWKTTFLEQIKNARAVGEIGLDQWIEDSDIDRQTAAFIWQLQQAAGRNLPVSIHCLKATDTLLYILKKHPCPKRGIHLHAYNGSAEQVAQFAEFGAYFSFHASQLSGNAKKAPAAVQAVPEERLLIETDAPDTLERTEDPSAFLRCGYEQVAKLRGVPIEQLAAQVATNFTRYFLDD
jgi:TatD DNase family protein